MTDIERRQNDIDQDLHELKAIADRLTVRAPDDLREALSDIGKRLTKSVSPQYRAIAKAKALDRAFENFWRDWNAGL